MNLCCVFDSFPAISAVTYSQTCILSVAMSYDGRLGTSTIVISPEKNEIVNADADHQGHEYQCDFSSVFVVCTPIDATTYGPLYKITFSGSCTGRTNGRVMMGELYYGEMHTRCFDVWFTIDGKRKQVHRESVQDPDPMRYSECGYWKQHSSIGRVKVRNLLTMKMFDNSFV